MGPEILIRDSQVPDTGILTFSRRDWAAFVDSIASAGPDWRVS
ncbi:DUF397 domain-containing protein [Dactylosporangium sp. CS-047395]